MGVLIVGGLEMELGVSCVSGMCSPTGHLLALCSSYMAPLALSDLSKMSGHPCFNTSHSSGPVLLPAQPGS